MDPLPVLVLGLALLAAVLTSSLSSHSPLSTSAVFLGAGLLAGPLGLDLLGADRGTVELMAEIALFAILFTDGQHAPWRALRGEWRPVPTAAPTWQSPTGWGATPGRPRRGVHRRRPRAAARPVPPTRRDMTWTEMGTEPRHVT